MAFLYCRYSLRLCPGTGHTTCSPCRSTGGPGSSWPDACCNPGSWDALRAGGGGGQMALVRWTRGARCGDSLNSQEHLTRARAGEMILGVGGLGFGGGGARGKGPPSVSKGTKPLMKLWQLLKNSSREVKRAHFRYIYWVPRFPPGNGINGAQRVIR